MENEKDECVLWEVEREDNTDEERRSGNNKTKDVCIHI